MRMRHDNSSGGVGGNAVKRTDGRTRTNRQRGPAGQLGDAVTRRTDPWATIDRDRPTDDRAAKVICNEEQESLAFGTTCHSDYHPRCA